VLILLYCPLLVQNALTTPAMHL